VKKEPKNNNNWLGLFFAGSGGVFIGEEQRGFNSDFLDFSRFKIPPFNPSFPTLYSILPNIIVDSNSEEIVVVNLMYFNVDKPLAL